MNGVPPDKEYMYFTTFKRPDQLMYYLLNSWPNGHGIIEKFQAKLEASEFSDHEFNEYCAEYWDGEVDVTEFIDWLEQDLFNNTIFDELKKRREKEKNGKPKQ